MLVVVKQQELLLEELSRKTMVELHHRMYLQNKVTRNRKNNGLTTEKIIKIKETDRTNNNIRPNNKLKFSKEEKVMVQLELRFLATIIHKSNSLLQLVEVMNKNLKLRHQSKIIRIKND